MTSHKGKQVCYVQKGSQAEPTPVTVGLFNHKFIEIKEGLTPGDKILLSPPLDASSEGMEDTFVGEGEDLPAGRTPEQIKAEQEKLQEEKRQQREGQGGGDGENAERGKSKGKGKGGFDRAAMMKRFDKDGDGQLNDEEQAAMRASLGGAKGGSKGGQKGERPRGDGGGGQRGPDGGAQ